MNNKETENIKNFKRELKELLEKYNCMICIHEKEYNNYDDVYGFRFEFYIDNDKLIEIEDFNKKFISPFNI